MIRQQMKRVKPIAKAFAFGVLALIPLWLGESFIATPSSGQQQSMVDFTGVAKAAIPSVVSIKVRGGMKDRDFFKRDEDEFESLDPFFERFFGLPRRKSAPQERSPTWGQASGFITSPDGLILTNNHVVQDAAEVTVILNDGREFKAKVLGQDPNTDVALLKIDATELPALSLGDSDALEVGQWVAAIGNPLGLQASMSVGVVSAKGRNNLDLARIEDFIQTDAAINRGNSGGPLLDMRGRVIGMNTAIVTSMATGGYMGIGFAIPSKIVGSIMEQLLNNGSAMRGYAGVQLQAIDADLAQALGLKKIEGALIAEVVKGSPAEKAGLKQGDVILTRDGITVSNVASLRNAIAMMAPGSRVTLGVQRNGHSLDLVIDLEAFPKGLAEGGEKSERFGFVVETLTPELAKKLNLQGESGVVVTKVAEDSPAGWAGLRPGALILEVNRQPVADLKQYQEALAKSEKGQPVLLLIKQAGSVRFLSIRLG